jgi:hypothetical protein
MQRVRGRFQPLLDAFGATKLQHPIHEAILVGITDDKSSEFFEEVPNRDGFFQVLAGCDWRGDDSKLIEQVFSILERAVRSCPFSNPDHATLIELFERLKPRIVDSE